MRSVCAVSYLLVLSEGLEARRLHMVSPAAEPVVAFYTNNTNNKRFWSSTLHSLSKNKPKPLLNFICTIRHSNIDTCKHCEPQWFNPQRDFTGLMFSRYNPDSIKLGESVTCCRQQIQNEFIFSKIYKNVSVWTLTEHMLKSICMSLNSVFIDVLHSIQTFLESILYNFHHPRLWFNCLWSITSWSHVWWLTLGDFEVWPGDGVFHNIWRDGAHLPF